MAPAVADTFIVTLKVVAATNKPVPKADAATFWSVKDGVMTPIREEKGVTDATGNVVLRIFDYREKRPLFVMSADRSLGGIVGVNRADDGKEVTVTLGPVVRVKGKLECKDLDGKPVWAGTEVAADGFRVDTIQSVVNGAMDFAVPPGKYKLTITGSDIEGVARRFVVSGDSPDHDLGTIDLKANPIAKLTGKPAPNWIIADARGAKADVKLADYKGRWVLIEFWGFWCGPCIAGSLPELMGLYEDHADHRDKFEVLAIHEHGAKSFAELDTKLPRIKEQYWQGKDLPFPVLLDATGETVKLYGITGFPTGLLVDPEGILVGYASAKDLEAKLPPLPAGKLWARKLDVLEHKSWVIGRGKSTLTMYVNFLKKMTQCDVDLDEDAIKACGLSAEGLFPRVLVGGPVTLRSMDELFLAPHGLGVVPTADGKKLLITTRPTSTETESYLQKLHAKDLADRLDREPTATEKNTGNGLDIKDQPLIEALNLMSQEYRLAMALDAKATLAGKLDATAKVSGRIDPAHLRKSMIQLLEPLGLTVVVRSEVVLVTPRTK